MTQIQAYESMSKEALLEHHLHTLQQHADDMDMLSKELAERPHAKIDRPMAVGNARFGIGIKTSTVLDAAARHYVFVTDEKREQERIELATLSMQNLLKYGAPSKLEMYQAWLEKVSGAAVPTVPALSGIDRTELSGAMGLLAGHGYKGSAAAIKRVLDSKGADAQPPTITLNGYQLLQALETVAPDYQVDTQQLECEARIQYGEGHSGKGHYCWLADYPEEGATLLLDEPTEPCHLVDKTPEMQAFQVDETDKMQDSLVTKPFTACTCPSGDGSLRWPCPVHPPESVNLMKWSNQQASSTDKKHGFTECVFIGDPPSGYESWAQWGATPIKKGVQIMALTKCDHSYPDNAHESEKKVQP